MTKRGDSVDELREAYEVAQKAMNSLRITLNLFCKARGIVYTDHDEMVLNMKAGEVFRFTHLMLRANGGLPVIPRMPVKGESV